MNKEIEYIDVHNIEELDSVSSLENCKTYHVTFHSLHFNKFPNLHENIKHIYLLECEIKSNLNLLNFDLISLTLYKCQIRGILYLPKNLKIMEIQHSKIKEFFNFPTSLTKVNIFNDSENCSKHLNPTMQSLKYYNQVFTAFENEEGFIKEKRFIKDACEAIDVIATKQEIINMIEHLEDDSKYLKKYNKNTEEKEDILPIDRDFFIKFAMEYGSSLNSDEREDIKDCFEYYGGKDGFILYSKLKEYLTKFGETITEEAYEEMVEQCGGKIYRDGEYYVNYYNFIDNMFMPLKYH
ncbi:MAG TPA: hypothetical protein V6C58_05770 [Allocoleopsis sp.]